jgi:hypothetical protein
MYSGQLALVIAAVLTGAAAYVNLVDQPARMPLGDPSLMAEWKTSYQRGFAMQAPLALVGATLGSLAWLQSGVGIWLVGSLLMLANWPYTLIGILPTNKILMATNEVDAGPTSPALIKKWNDLRAVRHSSGRPRWSPSVGRRLDDVGFRRCPLSRTEPR